MQLIFSKPIEHKIIFEFLKTNGKLTQQYQQSIGYNVNLKCEVYKIKNEKDSILKEGYYLVEFAINDTAAKLLTIIYNQFEFGIL